MALLDIAKAVLPHVYYVLLLGPITLWTYRYFFHPLKGYPGPFMAKITYGHGGYHAIIKDIHVDTYKNCQKYGSVYRAGPSRLVFNSLTAIQDIYQNPNAVKGQAYRNTRWVDPPNIFDTIHKNEHRHKRKIVGQVVSERSIRSLQPNVIEQVDIFLRRILNSSRRNDFVDMTSLCRDLAADVVARLAFGYSLHTQTKDTNRAFPKAITGATHTTSLLYTWPLASYLLPMLRLLGRSKIQIIRRMVETMILERRAIPKEAQADFYSLTVDEWKVPQGASFRDSELWGEAFFFILAGGTTVATAICGSFSHLAMHKQCYDRLATEIRQEFSSADEIIHGPKLASCKYLRAVIDESLRMTPPSQTVLWRQADPSSSEPFIVDGHVIPPGVEVGVSIWTVLHESKYFLEPFVFRPERWLDPEDGGDRSLSEEDRSKMRQAQVSFGAGDRMCTGKPMAYLEASLAIAKVLWYFDFGFAEGDKGRLGLGDDTGKNPWEKSDQLLTDEIFIADHKGPNLVFTPRGEFWRELQKRVCIPCSTRGDHLV